MQKARRGQKAKDWATADALRAKITELGYVVEDTPQGPKVAGVIPCFESGSAGRRGNSAPGGWRAEKFAVC